MCLKPVTAASILIQVYTTDDDTEVRPYVRVCHSKYGQYFSWTIYILEGLILVFGAFLAWETRQVGKYSFYENMLTHI